MDNPPPIPSYQSNADESHLNLLVIFHFVLAFFNLLGIVVLVLQVTMMSAITASPQFSQDPQFPASAVAGMMRGIFAVLGILILASFAMNVASAFFMQARKNRMFSMVTAGLNCLGVPLGTALGIFTFVVLTRDSVRQIYRD